MLAASMIAEAGMKQYKAFYRLLFSSPAFFRRAWRFFLGMKLNDDGRQENLEESPSRPSSVMNTRDNVSALEPSLESLKARFIDAISYYFNDQALLTQALTHSSVSQEIPDPFQRLEFLGDRVLNFIVTDYLFTTHPHDNEGGLNERSKTFISNANLAHVAKKLNLISYVSINKRYSPLALEKIASDACEALIGAIYKDGGLDAAQRFIYKHFALAAPQTLDGRYPSGELLTEEASPRHPTLKDFRKMCTYKDTPPVLHAATVKVGDQIFSAQAESKKKAKKLCAKQAYEAIQEKTVNEKHVIQLLASLSPAYTYEECCATTATSVASYNGQQETGTGSSLKNAKKNAATKLYQRLYQSNNNGACN
jgi:ribonuclease-3